LFVIPVKFELNWKHDIRLKPLEYKNNNKLRIPPELK